MTTKETKPMTVEDQIAAAVIDVMGRVNYLHRLALDNAGRFEVAKEAGVAMAVAIEEYLVDPEGAGLNTLREAAMAFMSKHSGGFSGGFMPVPTDAERVTSGQVPPQGHYGTCAVCGEGTTWCMGGFWTHNEDRPYDHSPVTR